jgi:hypothetical protein
VIAMNLFVAVIPLIIIGYAIIEAFNPQRDVGAVLAGNLHLTGSTAQIVTGTFSNARSGKSVALSISVISLLITGLDVSASAQVAFARLHHDPAARRPEVPERSRLAGAAARRHRRHPHAAVLAGHRPLWIALVAGAALISLEFGFLPHQSAATA